VRTVRVGEFVRFVEDATAPPLRVFNGVPKAEDTVNVSHLLPPGTEEVWVREYTGQPAGFLWEGLRELDAGGRLTLPPPDGGIATVDVLGYREVAGVS
jgi:hypothetical protein